MSFSTEDEVFDGNLDRLRDDCLHIDLEELSQLLASLNTTQKPEEIQESGPISRLTGVQHHQNLRNSG